MSAWEFFKLYIEMKLWIALYVSLPLIVIVVCFQYYLNRTTEKRKERYRERREYERKKEK